MRALIIGVVVLVSVLILERRTEQYVIPFLLASFFCLLGTLGLGYVFDLPIEQTLRLESSNIVVTASMAATYINSLIVIVSLLKMWLNKDEIDESGKESGSE